jgi:hypothetical protein
VRIHDDVSGIEEARLAQTGDRTTNSVGAQDGIAKTMPDANLALIFRRA